MRKACLILVAMAFVTGYMSASALAQWDPFWDPGDPHKMHWPQTPDITESGFDIHASEGIILADDWQCSETGWVIGINFWGSWMNDDEGEILSFTVGIYSDVPVNPPGVPFSRPGSKIWERTFPYADVYVRPYQTAGPVEGWWCPYHNVFLPFNHQMYYQYALYLVPDEWFWQVAGNIYWLVITANVAPTPPAAWGWKTTWYSLQFNDDAVWKHPTDVNNWVELWDYGHERSLDLAFVILPHLEVGSIQLNSFDAAVSNDRSIEVRWITAAEMDNAGFNVHRGASRDGEHVKVNGELIPAKGDELTGASYSFVDRGAGTGTDCYYWLEEVGLDGSSRMHGPVLASGRDDRSPAVFSLAQNHPNPFNPATEIMYNLPSDCHVRLDVYNVLGQTVATLVDEYQRAGSKTVNWDGRDASGVDVASGIYFYRITAGSFTDIKKMVLLR